MPTVETVRGPIDTADLGFTLSHEHVSIGFSGSAAIPEFLDWDATLERAVRDLSDAKRGGVDTIVDVAPYDQSRDVRLQAEASARSGVNIVVSTGTWLDVPHLFEHVPIDRIADFYAREITEGIDGNQGGDHQMRQRPWRGHNGPGEGASGSCPGLHEDKCSHHDPHVGAGAHWRAAGGRVRGRGCRSRPRVHRAQQ